jgi:hypothetical protein
LHYGIRGLLAPVGHPPYPWFPLIHVDGCNHIYRRLLALYMKWRRSVAISWRRRCMSRPLVDILLEIVVATAVIVLVLYVLFGPST